MNIKAIINSTDWQKRWVVPTYSLLSCSLMADAYHSFCLKRFKAALSYNVFISRDGAIICYQSEKENEEFGKIVGKYFKKDASGYINELKKATSDFYWFLNKKPDLADKINYEKLKQIYSEYLPLFIAMTRGSNYVKGKNSVRILKDLEKMRLMTESIYIDVDKYLVNYAKKMVKKMKYPAGLEANISYDELGVFMDSGRFPSYRELNNRRALVSTGSTQQWLSKSDVLEFEKAISNRYASNTGYISGQKAFMGKVRGVARIITNPKKYKQFNVGDILITGMTRPEYLMLMKKSGAIITDAGGVLSHAAITARELKIPCVIGTQVATKAFKDGDMVEVDANKGIVRKI